MLKKPFLSCFKTVVSLGNVCSCAPEVLAIELCSLPDKTTQPVAKMPSSGDCKAGLCRVCCLIGSLWPGTVIADRQGIAHGLLLAISTTTKELS
jgi:hypothetical protein